MLSIFPCDYWLFVCLGEMFIQVFWSFFYPVVCFCCCWIVVVYIPWILTPYQIHDLQVFSPNSVGCIFTLVDSVLWYTKVFYFDVGSVYFFCGMCFSFCFFSCHMISFISTLIDFWNVLGMYQESSKLTVMNKHFRDLCFNFIIGHKYFICLSWSDRFTWFIFEKLSTKCLLIWISIICLTVLSSKNGFLWKIAGSAGNSIQLFFLEMSLVF